MVLTCTAGLQASNEMGSNYNDVLSAQDVAVYGGLCALASFDRQELRTHVINNVSFREYMETQPDVGSAQSLCLLYLCSGVSVDDASL